MVKRAAAALRRDPAPDAADALAVAPSAHAHSPERAPCMRVADDRQAGRAVDEIAEDCVILDVAASAIWCIARRATLERCRGGRAAVLFIETVVREDLIRLYGFPRPPPSATGSACCRPCRASAPRSALAILSHAAAGALAQAIALRDKARSAAPPGVGPKLALRIVTELKDKAPARDDRRAVHRSGAIADRSSRRGPASRSGLGAGASGLCRRRGGAQAVARARRASAGEEAGTGAADP